MASTLFKLLLLLLFTCNLRVLGATPNQHSPTKMILMSHDALDIANFRQPKTSNVASDLNNLLFGELSNLPIDVQIVPIARLNLQLKATPNGCAVSRVKTKARLKENVFSLPMSVYMGLRLYFLPSTSMKANLSNNKNQLISLKRVFDTYPNRVLGTNRGRSYGDKLDRQMALLDRSNLVERGGKNAETSASKMLLRKRVDYLVEFPVFMKRIMDAEPGKPTLSSWSIAGSTPYIVGHIACAKTDIGKAFIKQIDEALLHLYQTPAFYQAHTRYLDASDIAQFNQYFELVFKTQVKH